MKSTKNLEVPLERAEVASVQLELFRVCFFIYTTQYCALALKLSRLGADLTLTL